MTLVGRLLILVCLVIGQWSSPTSLRAADKFDLLSAEEARTYLRQRLDSAVADQPLLCRGDVLCSASLMHDFYKRHDFTPVWNSNDRLFENITEFVGVLKSAGADGLRPADYHLFSISLMQGMLARLNGDESIFSPGELVDLDLLLTDAFLQYGSHLLNGRIIPEDIDEQWLVSKHDNDLAAILDKALARLGVKAALAELRPPHAGYKRMAAAITFLRNIAEKGGWPKLPTRFKLHEGMRHPAVPILRKRLMLSGDYAMPEKIDNDYFDGSLAAAVRFFQMRHGLAIDGVVGRRTLAALNVSAAERLHQFELNMERWRWLPDNLGSRYLLVNIPDFRLQVFDNSQMTLEMRVVAGKPDRRTPIFSDMVEYLVVNPYWYLPETIIVEDVVPLVLSDPEYLQKEKIKIFAAGGNEQMELDQTSIDWMEISKDKMTYKLRQDSGPSNALGRIKIVFPNRFSVYMHDTPSQGLFERNSRDFSSGCIRLENPVELAAYLAEGNSHWNKEELIAAVESGVRQVINLAEPVPIHIQYMTAWVNEQGVIHFRNDIYGWDKLLGDALNGKLPEPDPACVEVNKI